MLDHDIKGDPVLQIPGQEPSMSSKYAFRGQGGS